MGSIEKIALAIVTVGFATTLILPDRQTAKVFQAAGNVFNSALRTGMGR